jgi:hypothetical protein
MHREERALARALKMEWPRNVLHHSFISYRSFSAIQSDALAQGPNLPS